MEKKVTSYRLFIARKIPTPSRLCARQDAPNNRFIARNLSRNCKKILSKLLQSIEPKRSPNEPFYLSYPIPHKTQQLFFYNNLQAYYNKSVGSVKFIRPEPVLSIDRKVFPVVRIF